MATKLPRLNITLSDEQHALLMELGRLQGRSAASYLREMVDTAQPMLEALLGVYRQVEAAQEAQPQALQKAIRAALEGVDANSAQLSLLEHLAAVQPALSNDLAGSDRTERSEGAPKPAKRSRK